MRKKLVKPDVTVKRIYVLLTWSGVNRNPGACASAHRARQGCMMSQKIIQTTPVIIVAQHQRDEKCMKKWHYRTSGSLQWPVEVSFAKANCNKVREILTYKA